MKIVWSPTAISDLQSIRGYIAQDSPASARKIAQRIRESIRTLRDFPHSGRPGRIPGTRELIIPSTSYIAAYQVVGDAIRIASILHGKQRWPETF